jgi:ATP/ADP translocase
VNSLWIVCAVVTLIVMLVAALVIFARRAAVLKAAQTTEAAIDAKDRDIDKTLDGMAAADHYAVVARLRDHAQRRVQRPD